MSIQSGTDYDDKVGVVVQRMVDGDCQEILVQKCDEGGWTITGDKKLFWRISTPSEIQIINEIKTLKEIKKKNSEIILDYQNELFQAREQLDNYKALYEHSEKSYKDLFKLTTSFERQLNELRGREIHGGPTHARP